MNSDQSFLLSSCSINETAVVSRASATSLHFWNKRNHADNRFVWSICFSNTTSKCRHSTICHSKAFFLVSHRKKWLLQPFRANVIKNNNYNFYYMKICRDQSRSLFYRKANQNQPEFLCYVVFWCYTGKKWGMQLFTVNVIDKENRFDHIETDQPLLNGNSIRTDQGRAIVKHSTGSILLPHEKNNCLKQPVRETNRIGTIPTNRCQCYDLKGELKEEWTTLSIKIAMEFL